MSLNGAELEAMASELGAFSGARVQKVSVPAHEVVVLELRRPGRTDLLLLDGAPGRVRALVVTHKPANPERALAFQGLLRSHLTNARVDACVADARHRTLTLQFSTDRGPRALILEAGGRDGELLFVDGRRTILGGTLSERLRARGLRAGLAWTPPEPATEAAGAIRFTGGDGDFPFSAAIERHFDVLLGRQRESELRRRVLGQLRTARKKATRTLEKVRADLARIDEAAAYRRLGDLLKTALHGIKRGDVSVTVVEYDESGAHEVAVPLLAHLGPKENLERYYHLHRRLVRSRDVVVSRLTRLTDELAQVEERLAAAEGADEEGLALLDRTLHPAGAPERLHEPRKPGEERIPYRAFRSASGHPLWVGRSARDNDELTFRIARGNDLWLHARGVPGSHVVVPGVGADGPDQETLLDAATLAAHFSGGRGEAVVEVAATRRKYLQKPKGAPAGAVRFTQERSLALRLEPDRLARLLASEGA